MPYQYEYPRPALTADCVIFGFADDELKILLIKRAAPPYKDRYALPGGFVDENENTHQAALRELNEETNLKDIYVEQLQTFSQPDRDPRGRTVSVVYFALVKKENHTPKSGDDAAEAQWISIRNIPTLAFDHEKIIKIALRRLKEKIHCQAENLKIANGNFSKLELEQVDKLISEISIDN